MSGSSHLPITPTPGHPPTTSNLFFQGTVLIGRLPYLPFGCLDLDPFLKLEQQVLFSRSLPQPYPWFTGEQNETEAEVKESRLHGLKWWECSTWYSFSCLENREMAIELHFFLRSSCHLNFGEIKYLGVVIQKIKSSNCLKRSGIQDNPRNCNTLAEISHYLWEEIKL